MTSALKQEIVPATAAPCRLPGFWDDPQLAKGGADGGPGTVELSLHGISCYSCCWLIERAVEKKFPGVRVSVAMRRGMASLSFDAAKHQLSTIVAFIEKLGYNAEPWRSRKNPVNGQHFLIRMAVAWFCFGNIMMFATAEYLAPGLAAHDGLWRLFSFLSLGLCTLSVFYAAVPFYREAWRALRQRSIHIDQAISVSLAIVYSHSTSLLLGGVGHLYYDSLAAIIALLLTGRWIQQAAAERAEAMVFQAFKSMDHLYAVIDAQGAETYVRITDIQPDTRLKIYPGQALPVTSIFEGGEAVVSLEALTGEINPVPVFGGERIPAGALNMNAAITVMAAEAGEESFLTRSHAVVEGLMTQKTNLASWSSRLARVFFFSVLLAGFGILAWHWGSDPAEAMKRAVAAFLIACPCAFGVAVPLNLARAAVRGLRKGVLFRNGRAIEDLANLKLFCFDKSGTLTHGKAVVSFSEIDWERLARLGLTRKGFLQLLRGMTMQSEHHYSQAIAKWVEDEFRKMPEKLPRTRMPGVDSVTESMGRGLEAAYQGMRVKLGNAEFCGLPAVRSGTGVVVTLDGVLVATFSFADELLSDAPSTVAALRTQGRSVLILSGDSRENVLDVAGQVGIDAESCSFCLSPDGKKELIRGLNEPMAMVGNGFNDAMAMAGSGVGVSVATANHLAKDASDVNIIWPGLTPLIDAIEISRSYRRRIKLSFACSLIHNTVGLTLAATGLMAPVVAALLMPASSLVIILVAVTTWSRRRPDSQKKSPDLQERKQR